MFEGVEDVPWKRLGFGGTGSVPGLLREIAAAPSGSRAESPVRRLWHGLLPTFEPREVVGAAPCLVPYLVEAAGVARQPHRGLVLDLMTGIALSAPHRDPFRDPRAGPEPDHAALARAAMVECAGALVLSLDDVAPKVVVAAARLLACLPEAAPSSVPALRARAEKGARRAGDTGAVACVLAVAWLAAAEHADWFAGLLAAGVAQRDVRAAAAAGRALAAPEAAPPSEAVITLLADAEADPRRVFHRIPWHGDGMTPLGSALLRAERWHRALARELLGRPEQRETSPALLTARQAIGAWRASPAELLPMLADTVRDLIADAPARPRRRERGRRDSLAYAVRVISESGQAAAAQADLLAGMLTGDPAEPWPEVAAPAVEGLARLGDGRCVPWLVAALLDEYGHVEHLDVSDMIPAMVAHAPALTPALRTLLGPSSPSGGGGMQGVDCMDALVSWGEAAAPVVPAIAARAPGMYLSVALPLFGAVGPAAAEVLPRVLALLDDEQSRHVAAWAAWRITGEPGQAGQAATLLTERLARLGPHAADDIAPLLEQLGPAAGIAVPVLREQLHDAECGGQADQVAPARALWAITGESEGLVAPLLNAITVRPLPTAGHRGQASGLRAVEALGLMGPAAEHAAPHLELIANGRARVTSWDVWADERYQHAARRALALIQG
ncbi:hypothetical protein MTP10_15820 [Nonomuraea sp. 3-1Str]|uniref:hypothetical protein n=1 Tax=Nonomuraea sp. 3-1Str TaxID=2929801 RepID=UPI0028658612|nr:hypothetical protein [Nonomuraea sp. 3-1Str]MDR8410200.1 hypothetical protein [Nonomuraea sp. 3-1Str]